MSTRIQGPGNKPPVASTTSSSPQDGFTNLVLSRNPGYKTVIGNDIAVTVTKASGKKVTIAINAPETEAIFPVDSNFNITTEQLTPSSSKKKVWDISRLNQTGPYAVITVVSVKGKTARLSFKTYPQVSVSREEIASQKSDLIGGLTKTYSEGDMIGIFPPNPAAVIEYQPEKK